MQTVINKLMNTKQATSNFFKASKDYLSQANQSPQNFIRSYEDNISDIASTRNVQDFDLKKFLDPSDTYGNLGDPGMGAMRKEVLKGIESETQFTKRGMNDMLENYDTTGNLYSGSNKAGETQGSPLVNLLSGTTDNVAKDTMGILGTAALAGGVNNMMGGDFGDGALAGGLAAFSARGISKAYMSNMGDMEQSFMKNMLGDAYTTAGTTEIKQGTRLMDLSDAAKRDLTMADIGYGNNQRNIGEFLKGKKGATSILGKAKTRSDVKMKVSPEEARKMNLGAISDLDTKEAKAFIKRKGPNRVMEHNRTMTIGGGMLAGVAFTGRSDKRDYRRGFNSHRGNRI